MTVEDPTKPVQSARLAVEYLSAGLSELEITINRWTKQGNPQPLAIDDAAGAVAQALADVRRWIQLQAPESD
jgi:hypothetical protein